MKIVRKRETSSHQNNEFCTAASYPIGDKDISVALIELKGRYPSKGMVLNEKCKELAYVIKGSGKLVVGDEEIFVEEGDLVSIDPGEKYFWEGNLTLLMPCVPAWYSEQHKETA
jgi:mannose-6-phosphate isomerase-like protein (cupin superfamily)